MIQMAKIIFSKNSLLFPGSKYENVIQNMKYLNETLS